MLITTAIQRCAEVFNTRVAIIAVATGIAAVSFLSTRLDARDAQANARTDWLHERSMRHAARTEGSMPCPHGLCDTSTVFHSRRRGIGNLARPASSFIDANLECRVGKDGVMLPEPDRRRRTIVPLADLVVSVDHLLVGRSDPATEDLRTPLIVTLRTLSDPHREARFCIAYFGVYLRDHVPDDAWQKIDRIVANLRAKGLVVRRERPGEKEDD